MSRGSPDPRYALERRVAEIERRLSTYERSTSTSDAYTDGTRTRAREGRHSDGAYGYRVWDAAGVLVLDLTKGLEAWHVVGGAGEPAFQNSWVNFGGAYATAAFYKDHLGIVHLRGLVKDGIGPAIFTLPAGYRPAVREIFAIVAGGDTFGRVDVDPSGAVERMTGSVSYFSLSGVTFRAA